MPAEVNPTARNWVGEPPLAEYACRSRDWLPIERSFALFADRLAVRSKFAGHTPTWDVAFPLSDLRPLPDRRRASPPPTFDLVSVVALAICLLVLGAAAAVGLGVAPAGLAALLSHPLRWLVAGGAAGLSAALAANRMLRWSEQESATFFDSSGRPLFALVAPSEGEPQLNAFVERLQAQMKRVPADSPAAAPPRPLASYSERIVAPDPSDLDAFPRTFRLFADRLEIETSIGPDEADRPRRVVPLADLGPPCRGPERDDPPWALESSPQNARLAPKDVAAQVGLAKWGVAVEFLSCSPILLLIAAGVAALAWNAFGGVATAALACGGAAAAWWFFYGKQAPRPVELLDPRLEHLPQAWESVQFDVRGREKPLVFRLHEPRVAAEDFCLALRRRMTTPSSEAEAPADQPAAASPAPASQKPRSRRAADSGPPQAQLAVDGRELRLYADRVEEEVTFSGVHSVCIVELERLSPRLERAEVPRPPWFLWVVTIAFPVGFVALLAAAVWNGPGPGASDGFMFVFAAVALFLEGGVLLNFPARRGEAASGFLFKVDDGGPGRSLQEPYRSWGAGGAFSDLGLFVLRPESQGAEVDAFVEAVSRRIAALRGDAELSE